jgi:DNA replication and repair protein RecF
MYLRRLTLFNFKNYPEVEFDFSHQANALTGLNGSGKTNILDAIYYLCLCKSYFNATDNSSIKHGENFFSIHGFFELNENTEEILINLKQGQKKSIKRNLKEYQKLGDHIGILPIVMVAPVDQELITGGSEERRKLMDSIICQYDRSYLEDLLNYNRALMQRNALLKQAGKTGLDDPSLMQIWDERLSTFSVKIYKARKEFIERFIPLFNQFYTYLTNDAEQVSVAYESQLHEDDLLTLLERNAHRDRILHYTTSGTHKDDLELLLNGYPVKRIGSQGQQKSFVLAMKLAQFELISKAKGVKPILLLDDIFDKLDFLRIQRLMELVNRETFGQIFITDTKATHIQEIFNSIDVPLRIFNCSND